MVAEIVFEYVKIPPMDKDTFKEISMLGCSKTEVICNDVIYTQVDGLSMGSKVDLMLANICTSNYDERISNGSEVYFRYVMIFGP